MDDDGSDLQLPAFLPAAAVDSPTAQVSDIGQQPAEWIGLQTDPSPTELLRILRHYLQQATIVPEFVGNTHVHLIVADNGSLGNVDSDHDELNTCLCII